MIDHLLIRQEKPEDFAAIFEVNQLAFEQDGEAKLVEALRLNSTVFVPELSIVAIENNAVVGHILLTKISIMDSHGNQTESLALAPMAVHPSLQKKGIGGQLILQALETARLLQYKSVIVLGHEHYYPKFGFEPADTWHIKAPFDVPANAFMAIELVKGALQNVSGTVIYPKEFEAV